MITLTIEARDAAHARAILEAVERVDIREPEILAQPDGTGVPTGHTYRELADARRAGVLVAALTPRGLAITEPELAAYRQRKAERRRRRRDPSTTDESPEVTDLHEARVRALEAAGFRSR